MRKQMICSPCIYFLIKTDSAAVIEKPVKKELSTPEDIISCVCVCLGVYRYQIGARIKKQFIVDARCIAMKLIKNTYPKMTLYNIGKLFHRDHSTVIYALDRFDDMMETNDKAFKAKYDKVVNILLGGGKNA